MSSNTPAPRNLGYALLLLMIGLLSACAGPQLHLPATTPASERQESERQHSLALALAQEQQQRLLRVAYPLLREATPFCARKRASLGIRIANQETIGKPLREAAARDLGLGAPLQVLQVLNDSPAARAGIQIGDHLLRINGHPLGDGKEAAATLQAIIGGHPPGQSLRLQIRRQQAVQTLELVPEPICPYPVRLSNEDRVNAYADGQQIILTSGLLRFCRNDQELALIIAHELAHNALEHIPKQFFNAATGTLIDLLLLNGGVPSPGLFTAGGAHIHRQAFEAEADRLSLYILARSGYPLEGVTDFWRRMAAAYPEQIEQSWFSSHPSSPRRFLAMGAAIERIQTQRRLRQPLMPDRYPPATRTGEAP